MRHFVIIIIGCLLTCVESANAQSQVMQELFNNPRVDANTRVRALNTLMDSLQTALSLPTREIMPEERVGSRGLARLDERALAASFEDMVEALGIEMVVPEPALNPREILKLVVAILEAAKNQPPSVQTYVATEIGAMLARMNGEVTEDGRKTLDAWGFKFGTDSTLTDSILVPFDSIPFGTGHYGDFLDTSAVDTGAFYLTKRDLSPSTTYYFSAWGENEVGIAHGDTLSFVTELGVTTEDAADVTDSTGTILASFDFGDVQPTSVGLKWSANADLSAATDSVIALGADSTIAWSLSGLTLDSTYHYVAYGTNVTGTTFGDTLVFVASGDPCAGEESVTYNSHEYPLVVIGDQCWFAENLRTATYANGDPIPGDLTNAEWESTINGAQAIYDNSPTNLENYGRLYNWYAVDDSRGLCPSGWHVPTDGEWTDLTGYLGDYSVAGTAMKSSSEDSPSWDGTNTSGFSALPGGTRLDYNGDFDNEGFYGYWWSSSPSGTSLAWYRYLLSDFGNVNRNASSQFRLGFSVRCGRDE
jgi:uncharacterized protein (TIGR02145 family)